MLVFELGGASNINGALQGLFRLPLLKLDEELFYFTFALTSLAVIKLRERGVSDPSAWLTEPPDSEEQLNESLPIRDRTEDELGDAMRLSLIHI